MPFYVTILVELLLTCSCDR